MPSLLNGTGTAYYGRYRERPDGSYVTTEFFVLFYFPLFPLRSWRVKPVGSPKDSVTRSWLQSVESVSHDYEVFLEALDARQVAHVYFSAIFKLCGIVLGSLLFFRSIVDATLLVLKANFKPVELRAFSLDAIVVVGSASLLYWILLSKRPRRGERIPPEMASRSRS